MVRRRLDAEMVRRGLVSSRARAAEAIRAGRVVVAGAPAGSPARLVAGAEPIAVRTATEYVSRGGHKLAAALDAFGVVVEGRRCLDVGASTGGFTDCLLRRGAREVVAVDVGRGQLAWTLRLDPRVRVHERTNARDLTAELVGGPVDLCVADLSFISLRSVAPALVRVATPDAQHVLLVKPQFEAGRGHVGKGGVVRDPAVHASVLVDVVAALGRDGLGATRVVPSPLRGADGNVEFFVLAARGTPAVGGAEVAAAVAAAHEGAA
jgi:23S rRNA (cytidine1920-2'-O)/16S rRNA (cytidine1409-2'-O)-methyltransferase